MPSAALCNSIAGTCAKVHEFISNVSSVNEESITDYLLWQWSIVDRRFKLKKKKKFTHHEESSLTGADFALELWVIGTARSVPLLFQAKKFQKPHDGYVAKLCYPSKTKGQITKLQAYATANGLKAYYAIYTTASAKPSGCALHGTHATGVYVAEAKTIEAFADAKHGKKLHINSILMAAIPFTCLFCCPTLAFPPGDLPSVPLAFGAVGSRSNSDLPAYVQALRSRPSQTEGLSMQWLDSPELNRSPIRAIAVLDLKEELDA